MSRPGEVPNAAEAATTAPHAPRPASTTPPLTGAGHAAARVKVAVRDLSFFYGATQALRGITLEFLENRVTAIIGPSGCGKSTLIKAINRIAEVAGDVRVEGDVLLDGRSVFGHGGRVLRCWA